MENIENAEKDQALNEMQQQIEVAFQGWNIAFIDSINPPDEVRPLLTRILRTCFFAGVQIGIKISINHYREATKL